MMGVTSRADEAPLAAGARVDRFRIRRTVGIGAMSIVYEAADTQSGQSVALKVLRSRYLRDADVARRFIAEARTASRLTSPHAARIYDAGTDGTSGAHWIAMELLFGRDLDTVLESRGMLPTELAVDYVLQACHAIGEAHRLGIIHRDIKPSNFFLTSEPNGSEIVKVLDFGVSKATTDLIGEDSISETETQQILGTPAYMSPEQLRSSKNVDARTDIWALGVVLYELLTGESPFDEHDFGALCAAIFQREPRPVDALVPEVPAGLSRAVMRCLKKSPNDRFKDIASVKFALAPFASKREHDLTEVMTPSAGFSVPGGDAGDTIQATTIPDEEEDVDDDAPTKVGLDPSTFGNYKIITELGSGGMGNVVLARRRDEEGALVVIKRLHEVHDDDPDFEAMFRDEARIAARLDHPNVVRTFDAAEARGEYYIAMEFVEGQSLRGLLGKLRKGKTALPVPMAVSLLADTLAGLHHAHDLQGDDGSPLEIVHRDVTPHNVLVGYDGVVRIIDFGIAKAVGRQHKTAQGMVKGKMAYIAPEQAAGSAVDRRADVFSVGVMLYELLTSRRYWAELDNDMAIMVRLAIGQLPPPPSAIVPNVDRELERIYLRATMPKREERYATAAAMERDLRAWLARHGGRPAPSALGSVVLAHFAEERRQIDAKLGRKPTAEPIVPVTLPPIAEDSAQQPTRVSAAMLPATSKNARVPAAQPPRRAAAPAPAPATKPVAPPTAPAAVAPAASPTAVVVVLALVAVAGIVLATWMFLTR